MPRKVRYPVIINQTDFRTSIDIPDFSLRQSITGRPFIPELKAFCATLIINEIAERNRSRKKIPFPSHIKIIESGIPQNSHSFVIAVECEDLHQQGLCEKITKFSAYPLQIVDSLFDTFTSFLALSIASKSKGNFLPILGILVLFVMDMLIFIGVGAPAKLQAIGKHLDDLCRPAATASASQRRGCKDNSLYLAPYFLLHTLASGAAVVYSITNYHTLIALAHKGDSINTKPSWLNDDTLYLLAIISAVFAFISNTLNANSLAHEVANRCSKPFQHYLLKRRSSDVSLLENSDIAAT
jgi:hypothetical protein